MELLRLDERPAEFQWKDITFLYRTKPTPGDDYEVHTAGRIFKGNEIQYDPWDFYRTMVRVFVVGWRGVTENGKEVPYNYKTLTERVPGGGSDDLFMLLGRKIAFDTGFLAEGTDKDQDLKNG